LLSVRIVGPGRAGRSLAGALVDAGCDVHPLLGRHDDLAAAAHGVELLVLATPDAAIAAAAAAVAPEPETVVLHLSGALGLDVLAPHRRRATLHPLAPLPSAEVGRVRLRSGITFAVAGDPVAERVARLLDGRVVEVDDASRGVYHAAACIASNHVVALMGQVERVAAAAGLELDAFVGLARAALVDVAELGPGAALTGPAARGDEATITRHRVAIDPGELPGYDAGVALARRLARSRPPSLAGPAGSGEEDGAPRQTLLLRRAAPFAAALDAERARGRRVGLVPTMGALHAGHRSLIERAAAECDTVAVTVFVNPLQFSDPADLAAYHRDLPADLALAAEAGARFVFAPDVEEMFPGFPDPPATTVHVAGVSESFEGASRPGHFDGVATVVSKLFALAGSCRAYFGEKDFQQLAVVRLMVADLAMPVEVVGCPTVRDPDGLALSSRNGRLSGRGRRAALALRRALDVGVASLMAGERHPLRVRAAMWRELSVEDRVHPDYAAVVDARTLEVPAVLGGEVRLLVAAEIEGVRLIDNDGAVLDAPVPAPSPESRVERALVLVEARGHETGLGQGPRR